MAKVQVAILNYRDYRHREDNGIHVVVARDEIAMTKALANFVRAQLDEEASAKMDDTSDAAVAQLITNDLLEVSRGAWDFDDDLSGAVEVQE